MNQDTPNQERTPLQHVPTIRDALPTLHELLNAPVESYTDTDIAVANLVCACGLPGIAPLSIEECLDWLDVAARTVRLETQRNYYKFLASPVAFNNSQAKFCMVCMVTVLQRQFGVRYNPKWKGLTPNSRDPEGFGNDASDLFIHAIIDGIGGTCCSLPVLYVAVGRRLGYPLRLVKAARHLFVRWDDPDGTYWHQPDRFNIEATGPGVHLLPDEHYRTWPRAIPDEDVIAGIFLRSLCPREEVAEFLVARGCCLQLNHRVCEAVDALAQAVRLAPGNRYFVAWHDTLRTQMALRQRGHDFVNAPILQFEQKAIGPFWMNGPGGQKILVQVLSPVTQPWRSQPEMGRPMMHQQVLTPNGWRADAWIPVNLHSSPMTSHWISLEDGRYALIHRPVCRQRYLPHRAPLGAEKTPSGHRILPTLDHGVCVSSPGIVPNVETAEIPFHERVPLAIQIRQVVARTQNQSRAPDLPILPSLALPAGPAVPHLPSSIIRDHYLT